MSAACGQDDGGEVRNIGETEGATGSGSASGSATASGSAHASGSASGSGSASASGAAASPAFKEAAADTRADYTLVDYSFQGPDSVKGTKVWFTARNTGTENHELEILDASGEALGEIAEFAPNAEAEPLAVELQPGTYTLQCILETADGRVHKDLGMVKTLTVT